MKPSSVGGSTIGWREALLPGDEAPDSRRPFRIDEPGPLRRQAEALCGRVVGE